MKRILYLMNVDWNWIKQRPQFIAEQLSKKYEIICIGPHWYNRNKLQNRTDGKMKDFKILEIYGLPYAKKCLLFRQINNLIKSWYTHTVALINKSEIIYITYPEQYGKWMKNYPAKIIYDCMDNHVALTKDERVKSIMEKKEAELVGAADYILISSLKLMEVLKSKYMINTDRIKLMRNGYNGAILDIEEPGIKDNKKIKLGYIGTVGSWFDFDVLEKSTQDFRNIEYHIIGPALEKPIVTENERIIFEGVVEHDKLLDKIADYDCLIMPFILNEIVEAVDPVKLYEYINFNKNIITIYYKEVEQFRDFVFFYTTYEEYVSCIKNLLSDGKLKYSKTMRESFLKENNWNVRVKVIDDLINK